MFNVTLKVLVIAFDCRFACLATAAGLRVRQEVISILSSCVRLETLALGGLIDTSEVVRLTIS